MSFQLNNGLITFGDGTTLSTSTPTYSTFSSAPTQLSQFTNDLGNYGGWMTSSSVDTSTVVQNQSNGNNGAYWGMGWNGSKFYPQTYNCNCLCNC